MWYCNKQLRQNQQTQLASVSVAAQMSLMMSFTLDNAVTVRCLNFLLFFGLVFLQMTEARVGVGRQRGSSVTASRWPLAAPTVATTQPVGLLKTMEKSSSHAVSCFPSTRRVPNTHTHTETDTTHAQELPFAFVLTKKMTFDRSKRICDVICDGVWVLRWPSCWSCALHHTLTVVWSRSWIIEAFRESQMAGKHPSVYLLQPLLLATRAARRTPTRPQLQVSF